MKQYVINRKEVDEVTFCKSFYFTSLDSESTDLTLTFMRGLAEELLTKEQIEHMIDSVSKFYTFSCFRKLNPIVCGGALFEVNEIPEPEVAA